MDTPPIFDPQGRTGFGKVYSLFSNPTEVSLGKADLKGANLTKANLDGAVLCHTTMPDAKENNSGCTQN